MKKITEAFKKLQKIKNSQWRNLCKNSKKAREYKRNRNTTTTNNFYYAKIIAPEFFGLNEINAHNQVAKFIRKTISTFQECEHGTIQLDFSGTKRFVIGATLLFYAELSNLIMSGNGNVRFRCKPPRNNKASQVLTQIGVFEMCGQSYRVRTVDQDVVHWRVARGQKVELSACNQVLDEIEGRLAEPLQRSIDAGLCEALTNVVHHAYIADRDDGTGRYKSCKNWWVFSQVKNNLMSVGICDLGLGIPITLEAKHPSLWDKIKSTFHTPTDSQIISAAVEESRSRTGERQRGKGLGQIARAISSDREAYVAIYSNKGSYTQRGGVAPALGDYDESIFGTVIVWRVPVEAGVKM